MNRVHLTVLLIITALGQIGVVSAQTQPDAPVTPRAPKTLHVLTEAQVDPARMLPPPYPADSNEEKAELTLVQNTYKNRTPERRAQAEWDDKHETVELFFATLGPRFDLKSLPATAKLMAIVENEQSVAANIAKRYFLRRRPWAIDPTLVACDYKPNAAPLTSYPSGHATLSYSEGAILAALMPEKAQPILTRAEEYAYSRVVCGAHFPSDLEASHVLGTELARLMMNEPGFKTDFEAARKELRAAKLTE